MKDFRQFFYDHPTFFWIAFWGFWILLIKACDNDTLTGMFLKDGLY